MQTSKITRIAVVVLVLLFLVLSVISCSTHVHTHGHHHHAPGKKIPPGQAKKMNGDQSAKAYAPGQQKKR
ncbi:MULTISPECIES: hypothetical protein [Flavobacterium]|uniref:Quinol oxidase subunit 4 n=1 Tax=Flavobacterium anhuiense TaxID=459526 RepID=A0AAC9CWI5_9FLAO|nr:MULTISPECIES: hypothetical protein [Flavobacterium]AOC93247.1 hypothetical protein BB050_00091 [Flavobacterium anhuiense]EJG03055.1 hypothetical protein FF52_02645 [Flavobacterium sp. F52]URM35208.1 hypothetical protein LLY39_12165 [Flavobacterium anhuiense]